MNTSVSVDTRDLKVSLVKFKANLHDAGGHICDRMGLAAEHIAVTIVAKDTGQLAAETRYTGTIVSPTGHSGELVANSTYSIFVEYGFTGHFVPFRIAPTLYREAIIKWGWTVPSPDQVKNPRPGEKYLIPRGRKAPTTGVKVSGKAQPFLKPALTQVDLMRDQISTEEIQKAIQLSSK